MSKIHVDKKNYRAKCREQVKAGRINNAEGVWITSPNLEGKSVDVAAGYRFGNSKKRRGPKAEKPEVE